MQARNIRKSAAKGCPVCGKAEQPSSRPFCSQGCKDRDLLRWLGDAYRVPGKPADENGKEIDIDGLDSEA